MNKRIEWDEAKRRANIRKHGFDFVGVEIVFDGVTYTIEDERFDYSETRYITFGFWDARIVQIVHTETEKVIRIILVRKATKYEEKEFLYQIGYGLEEN
ncbi:MAG: BrnT family toxin [Chloroflexi bacterium]|nr:BrnT family toxin [Chloroflexota bacterium]